MQEILHPRDIANPQYKRTPMPSTEPVLKLFDLIQSHRVTAVIYVAAKLGIAELLRDGPRAPDELAKATGTDKDALGRLLTALSTVGICAPAGQDRYSLTEIGAGLDGGAGADAIILKSVIHDWNDERCCIILQNCRQALPSEGTLLLVERSMPQSPGVSDADRAHALSDLNMLRGPGGRERTEKQYHRLLTESGFRPTSLHPAGRFNVIESRVR
jgi:hypothetical protein